MYRAALPVPGQAAGCVREEQTLDHVLSSYHFTYLRVVDRF